MRHGAGLRGRPAGQLPKLPTYKGCSDIIVIMGNMGVSKFRFPHVINEVSFEI